MSVCVCVCNVKPFHCGETWSWLTHFFGNLLDQDVNASAGTIECVGMGSNHLHELRYVGWNLSGERNVKNRRKTYNAHCTYGDKFAERLHGSEQMLLGGFCAEEMHESHGELNGNIVKDLQDIHRSICIKFSFISTVGNSLTTVLTSLQAKLWIMAVPTSCSVGHVANKQCTATLVVARMFDVCWLFSDHSEMYSSHSDELVFSNKLHI